MRALSFHLSSRPRAAPLPRTAASRPLAQGLRHHGARDPEGSQGAAHPARLEGEPRRRLSRSLSCTCKRGGWACRPCHLGLAAVAHGSPRGRGAATSAVRRAHPRLPAQLARRPSTSLIALPHAGGVCQRARGLVHPSGQPHSEAGLPRSAQHSLHAPGCPDTGLTPVCTEQAHGTRRLCDQRMQAAALRAAPPAVQGWQLQGVACGASPRLALRGCSPEAAHQLHAGTRGGRL